MEITDKMKTYTINDILNEKYGVEGTTKRDKFDKKIAKKLAKENLNK